MTGQPRLSFYAYDSLDNPWVGGGGALRDFEVLRRFTPHARVTLWVGRYPGFRAGTRGGVEIRGLGLGIGNNWLCRVTYALAANVHVLFNRDDVCGNTLSSYAPLLTGMFRRRFYQVAHHYVGRNSFKRDGLFGIAPFLYEQLLLRLGRHYLVLNHVLRDRIARLNPKARVTLTRNGLAPSLFSLQPRPEDPPFILFVGRFDVYMKGLDLLMDAYARVAADLNADLVLAGRAPPETEEEVRRLIPENLHARVRLELNVTPPRKEELLASCLFFCSPSRFEGFGIAALEANAAGKAVLAAEVDGFRDSLAFGETALGVPPENPEALQAGLLRLTEDAELRERLGRQGRERARAFSWDAIAEQEWKWIAGVLPTLNARSANIYH